MLCVSIVDSKLKILLQLTKSSYKRILNLKVIRYAALLSISDRRCVNDEKRNNISYFRAFSNRQLLPLVQAGKFFLLTFPNFLDFVK